MGGVFSGRVRELENQVDCLQSNFDYVSEELSTLEQQVQDSPSVRIEKNPQEPQEPTLKPSTPQDIIDTFICPITLQVMEDPWMDYEGNTYEKNAILESLEREHISPLTRNPLFPISTQLFPNRTIKTLIDNLRV